MKVRALKTFSGRYGLIRTGTEFECEPSYYRALLKNGMVAKVEDRIVEEEEKKPPAAPGPSKDRAIPAAPRPGGKEKPGDARKSSGGTGHRTTGGTGLTSRSLRADLPSRGKTSQKSAGGGAAKGNTPAAAKGATENDETGPASGPAGDALDVE